MLLVIILTEIIHPRLHGVVIPSRALESASDVLELGLLRLAAKSDDIAIASDLIPSEIVSLDSCIAKLQLPLPLAIPEIDIILELISDLKDLLGAAHGVVGPLGELFFHLGEPVGLPALLILRVFDAVLELGGAELLFDLVEIAEEGVGVFLGVGERLNRSIRTEIPIFTISQPLLHIHLHLILQCLSTRFRNQPSLHLLLEQIRGPLDKKTIHRPRFDTGVASDRLLDEDFPLLEVLGVAWGEVGKITLHSHVDDFELFGKLDCLGEVVGAVV
jgi:hypothetical protein